MQCIRIELYEYCCWHLMHNWHWQARLKFHRPSNFHRVWRFYWVTVCKTVRPMLSDRWLSCLSVCNVGVLWPNGRMVKMPLGTEVDLAPGHIVLDRDPALPRKGAQHPPPTFEVYRCRTAAHVYCGQTVTHLRLSNCWAFVVVNLLLLLLLSCLLLQLLVLFRWCTW